MTERGATDVVVTNWPIRVRRDTSHRRVSHRNGAGWSEVHPMTIAQCDESRAKCVVPQRKVLVSLIVSRRA